MPYLYTGTVGRAYSDTEVTSGAATGASVGASSRDRALPVRRVGAQVATGRDTCLGSTLGREVVL